MAVSDKSVAIGAAIETQLSVIERITMLKDEPNCTLKAEEMLSLFFQLDLERAALSSLI